MSRSGRMRCRARLSVFLQEEHLSPGVRVFGKAAEHDGDKLDNAWLACSVVSKWYTRACPRQYSGSRAVEYGFR